MPKLCDVNVFSFINQLFEQLVAEDLFLDTNYEKLYQTPLLNKAANSCFIDACNLPVLIRTRWVLIWVGEQCFDDVREPSFLHHQSTIMPRLREIPQQA